MRLNDLPLGSGMGVDSVPGAEVVIGVTGGGWEAGGGDEEDDACARVAGVS